MTKYLRRALLALALCGNPLPALAQTVSPPPPEGDPCPPTKQQPQTRAPGQSGCGVIVPPAVGDRGVVKPPATSLQMPMPVIPPPGTPGGNPSVQPR